MDRCDINRSIDKLLIDQLQSAKQNTSEVIYKIDQPLQIKFVSSFKKNLPAPYNVQDLPNWIHIHQVFDTRDSGPWTSDPVNHRHQGYLSCGATSAMEVVSSYGILPPKPFSTYGHTSEYGLYISDSYSYNSYTYNGFTINPNGNPGFTTGAHGFMWNYGSPHSNTVEFLNRHGIEAELSDYMTWSKVKTELDLGFPYILCSTSLTDGHIVVAVGQYQSGHTLYCNDPYGNKNEGSYGGIRNGKNAIYDWADANTGHMKITPVVWGVTSRYSRTLRMVSTYPEKGQQFVSPSTHIFINFYGAIDPASIENRINIVSEQGEAVDFTYDEESCENGIIEITPANKLDENTTYYVTIQNGIESTDGLKFKMNEQIFFSTDYEEEMIAEMLDDFEYEEGWTLVTSGTNEQDTFMALSSEVKHENSTSLQLDYEFNSAGNGYCRVLFMPEPQINSDEFESIGLWVFGDYSRNTFEIWFSDESGSIKQVLDQSINWSGWKFLKVDLEDVPIEDEKYFNCFAVRQTGSGRDFGEIYIDGLVQINKMVLVQNCSPAQNEEDVDVNSSVEIEFNREMNAGSVESAFEISPDINGLFEWNSGNTKLTFAPSSPLTGNVEYIITIDNSAVDAEGNQLAKPFQYNFKTARTKLSLVESYPGNNDQSVATFLELILRFDHAINPGSLSGNILFLDANGDEVPIYVRTARYSQGVVQFQPQNDLIEQSNYKLVLKPGVTDTEGLKLDEEITINFKTEMNRYESGNILFDFETDVVWINPRENESSIGVDFISTKFSNSGSKSINGETSGELQYKFNGVNGVCRLQLVENIPVNTNGVFGVWIYGDFSKSEVEYWFTDEWEEIFKLKVDTIDWTGWKLVSVDLSDYSAASLYFNSIVINQPKDGSNEGVIYFDDIQTDIILPVEEDQSLPTSFSLEQNYPNPFNPSTKIRFTIPGVGTSRDLSQQTTLVVFDILGREVTTLVNEQKKPGYYEIQFNGSHLPAGKAGLASGIYFYRLNVGEFVSTKKMLLLK